MSRPLYIKKQGSQKEEKIIMKKKIATILTAAVIGATAFTTIVSAASGDITVVSREDGSGTRGAFVELFGIQEEQDGEKVDMTTDEASVTNSRISWDNRIHTYYYKGVNTYVRFKM